MKAVCLLSGGLDSSTCLGVARRDGFECYALSFDYGQRHRIELEAAASVAWHFGVREHQGGADRPASLRRQRADGDIDVPKDSLADRASRSPTFRRATRSFLSYAMAWAEVLECSDIFIGVNAIDYSGYPDCRPEFIAAFEQMANLATKAGVEGRTRLQIHTPLDDSSTRRGS